MPEGLLLLIWSNHRPVRSPLHDERSALFQATFKTSSHSILFHVPFMGQSKGYLFDRPQHNDTMKNVNRGQ